MEKRIFNVYVKETPEYPHLQEILQNNPSLKEIIPEQNPSPEKLITKYILAEKYGIKEQENNLELIAKKIAENLNLKHAPELDFEIISEIRDNLKKYKGKIKFSGDKNKHSKAFINYFRPLNKEEYQTLTLELCRSFP